jgi:hypothetical protein
VELGSFRVCVLDFGVIAVNKPDIPAVTNNSSNNNNVNS